MSKKISFFLILIISFGLLVFSLRGIEIIEASSPNYSVPCTGDCGTRNCQGTCPPMESCWGTPCTGSPNACPSAQANSSFSGETCGCWGLDPSCMCMLSIIEGSEVLMADASYKNIEDIKTGDYVASFNIETKELISSKVEGISRQEEEGYLVINNTLKVTKTQYIYLNKNFQKAENVKLGDFLLDERGKDTEVFLIDFIAEKVPTYHLSVGCQNNFFTGGYLVHNEGLCVGGSNCSVSGNCNYVCDSGWVDCDGNAANGCECNTGGSYLCVSNVCQLSPNPCQTHNVWGWAWSNMERPAGHPEGAHDPTIGWISFSCKNCSEDPRPAGCPAGDITNYGVDIDASGNLSGHAWSENIGWVSFDRYRTHNPPGDPGPGPIATVNLSNGEVSGWARALSACQDNLWNNAEERCTGTGAGDRAGGWAGWIKLRGIATDGSPYGVEIDTNTGEFSGWAWGDDVVGWISFNCLDTGACPSSDYKVMTDFSFSQPPEATELRDDITYCGFDPAIHGPGVAQISLSWLYIDPNSDPQNQSAYSIEVQQRNMAGVWEQKVLCENFETSTPAPGDRGVATFWINRDNSIPSPGLCEGIPVANRIEYGKETRWQVQVEAGEGNWSDWSGWRTVHEPIDGHAYPWVDFGWSPKPAGVSEDVDFEDKSTCYDVPIGDPCGYNIAIPSHTWTFPGIEGTNYECINPAVNCKFAQNPKIKFLTTLTSGSQVSLRVCDSLNYCCPGNKPITVTLPLPEYREVRPTGLLDNFLARIANIFTR